MAGPDVPHRVYLHVGVPKSGTTFLQASLAKNRKQLREAGIVYPGGGKDPMFRAALDVRGNHKTWGLKRSDVEGTWDQLCRKARKHDGVTVLSHELLAAASSTQITRARSMLAGLDVHVVVTARDLARQVVAEWQEGVKNGARAEFDRFQHRIMSGDRGTDHAFRFWAAQEIPGVLARWTSWLPPENVHLVTCPPPHADPGLLWRRFGAAVGFDADRFAAAETTNSTLGVAQIDLLRRVNTSLDRRLVQPGYGRVVKRYFTKQLLAEHRSARPELPAASYDELVAVGEQWGKEIERAGYTVHGDLAELVPVTPGREGAHPDHADAREQVATAGAVIAELLLEVDRLRADVSGLESDKKSLKKKRRKLKERLAGTG